MFLDLGPNPIVACIVEGKAEAAVIELLLKNNLLIFTEDDLLSGELIKERNADKFSEKYLGKRFDSKVSVIRILDSDKERFNLKKEYRHKCNVYNIITRTEIEMLIILNERKYEQFKKLKNIKPSDFCSQCLDIGYVKSKSYWEDYFSDVNKLIYAIKEYDKIAKKSDKTKDLLNLNDLLLES